MRRPPPPEAEEGPDRPWLIPLVIGVIVTGLFSVVLLTRGGDGDGDGVPIPTAGAIFLEPLDEVGRDPFTASVAAPPPPSTVPPQTVTIGDVSGGTPGLYGGLGGPSTCDKQPMIDALAANPAKRAAWAQAQGIAPAEVAAYVGGLTPVLVRSDTRVTNHGFRDGASVARQSALQAGTAVLVDNRGMPRVRCASGNPLLLPQGVPIVRYVGPEWPGFDRTLVTVIQQNTTTLNQFAVVNVTTGETYDLPVGG